MELGKKILELRKKKGLSQESLGDKIDVTRQTISNWELGITQPNPDQLKLLSKELNVSIDELLDNDIKNLLVEKVSNTEKLSGLILKTLKVLVILIIIFVVGFICLILFNVIYKSLKHRDEGVIREESIHCRIYGEEHTYGIKYYELTGEPIELGGDAYFSDILDLGKYNDAHQIFNVINDYVKKNGGTCNIIDSYNLNDIVNFYLKEGTLTKTGATFILENNSDYTINYGEDFWIEKYDSDIHDFQVLKYDEDKNCAFNMIGYILVKNKPMEITQNWSCFYNKLDKGMYRIIKKISFESDNPVSEEDEYYIYSEFEIE